MAVKIWKWRCWIWHVSWPWILKNKPYRLCFHLSVCACNTFLFAFKSFQRSAFSCLWEDPEYFHSQMNSIKNPDSEKLPDSELLSGERPKNSIYFRSLTTNSTKNTSIPTKGSLTTTTTTTICCQPSRSLENHCWFCEQQHSLNSVSQKRCCWNHRAPDKNPNANGWGWNLNEAPVTPSFPRVLAMFYSAVRCHSRQGLPFTRSD